MARLVRLTIITFLAAAGHDAAASVPLTLVPDGHLTVPAMIGGTGPYAFILDTGADEAGVYPWLAQKLELPAGNSDELSGQTGTLSVRTYRLDDLTIDGHRLQNAPAYGMPKRADGGEEAGVAGNDLMDGVLVVFDFPCHRVEFHASPSRMESVLYKDAVLVEAGSIQDGTVLTLPVQINGVSGVAMLDTGSRDSRIGPAFAAASGVDTSSAAFRDGGPIYGFSSKSTPSRIGPIDRVQFAGQSIMRPKVRVMDLPALRSAGIGDHVMILGTDLMRGYRLVYDHRAKRLWFGSSRCRV